MGGKKANEWGLYDMVGNVWQWCGGAVDPNSDGKNFPKRGGSYQWDSIFCHSAFRGAIAAGGSRDDLGFRVVLRPGYPPPRVGTPTDASKPDPGVRKPDANSDPKPTDLSDAAVVDARSHIPGDFKDDYTALQSPKVRQAFAGKLLGLAQSAEAHSLRR